MKKIRNIILVCIGLVIGLVVALVVARNSIIKTGIEQGTKHAVGLETSIEGLNIGLASTDFEIKGLNVSNPEGFKQYPTLAKIPLIYIDYNLDAFMQKKIHFTKIELNLEEVAIVKSKDGKVNLKELAALGQSDSAPEKAPEEEPSKPAPEIKIDQLVLSIERVKYMDYSGDKPKERTINIGLKDETFENVDDINAVVKIIVLKVITQTGLTNLNLAIDTLSEGLTDVLKAADLKVLKDVTSGVTDQTKKIGSQLGEGLSKGTKGVTEGVGKTADSLKKGTSGLLKGILPGKKDE